MNNLKVVLVTGASSGIGKCCAEHLSQQGYRVYGTSRRSAMASGARMPADKMQVNMIHMDVTDGASVKKGIDYLTARESAIDLIVNNAGYALIGSLEDTFNRDTPFTSVCSGTAST